MPTSNEYGFKSPAPPKIRSKNPSVKREFSTSGQNTTGTGSKNPSGDKEKPYSDAALNRNPSGDLETPYGVTRSRNSSKRNSDIHSEFTEDVASSKNKGSANKTDPQPRINSGKTKVTNYPPGRNRGRNFKG